jgi:hypothetical protein
MRKVGHKPGRKGENGMTFCDMYKSSGCEECPNRWVCKNSTVKERKEDMKKSEMLQAELEQLKHEDDSKVKEMVYYPGHKPEDRDKNWNKYWNEYGSRIHENQKQLAFEIRKEQYKEMDVGDGATVCLFSDKHAATIIKRTKTTITVQYDKAIRDPNFKPEFIPGGFSAHCTNQREQSYTYEPDPEGRIEKYYWSEVRGRWQGGGDGSIVLIPGRHEFYDYNFNTRLMTAWRDQAETYRHMPGWSRDTRRFRG